MKDDRYRMAGWAALASALTFLISGSITAYHDVIYQPALAGGGSDLSTLLVAVAFDVASKILGIYALLKFRQLLHERYEFHAVDNLILVLIFGGILLSGIAYTGRMLSQNLPVLVIFGISGAAFGILGIIFALRLLRVPGSLNGYLKPLAYTELIGSICFALVFLAPIGMILMIVFSVLLGLVLLGADDASLEEVEFV